MCDPDPGAGGGERVLAIGDKGPLRFLRRGDGGTSGGGGGRGGPDFRAVGERGGAVAREGETGGSLLVLYEP